MRASFESGLDGIRKDRSRGAGQLAEDGLRLIAGALKELSRAAPGKVLDEGRRMTRALKGARPSMAPIFNWAAFLLLELEKTLGETGVLDPGAIEQAASRVLGLKRKTMDSLAAEGRGLLEDVGVVFTLSYSSTVERIIEKAHRDLRVIVAESRPLFEGRRLAASAQASGKGVEVVTDAQAGLAVREAEAVLLGADAILGDLSAVNKAGSYPAALAARDLGRRVIAAADTFKVNPWLAAGAVELEEGDGGEVWAERPELCRNVYFETVPARLIDVYLTEKGPLSAEEMTAEVRRIEKLFESAPAA
ncbi:MAG: translation initiation factor eIF-2B [Candidatus Nitrospinota bacterium M3_3B_026]